MNEKIQYNVEYSTELQAVGLVRLPERAAFYITPRVVTAVYNQTGGEVFYKDGALCLSFMSDLNSERVKRKFNEIFIKKILENPAATEYVIDIEDIQEFLKWLKEEKETLIREKRIQAIKRRLEEEYAKAKSQIRTIKALNELYEFVRTIKETDEEAALKAFKEKMVEVLLKDKDYRIAELEMENKKLKEEIAKLEEEIKRLRRELIEREMEDYDEDDC